MKLTNDTEVGYAGYAQTDGIGRNVLEARLREASRELITMFQNLSSVQSRCTELLLEKRELALALRLLADLRVLECSVSSPACGTCVRCRAKALTRP